MNKQDFLEVFSEGLGMYLDTIMTDKEYHIEDFYLNIQTFLQASEAVLAAHRAYEMRELY
jgi:hypothetical protein